MDVIEQYSIVLVNLDPTLGSEMKKTRPCVVLSPNEMNKYLKTIIIAPMTTAAKKYPTRVTVKFQDKKGAVAIDQIRTIDRARIVKQFCKLQASEILDIKSVIAETLVH